MEDGSVSQLRLQGDVQGDFEQVLPIRVGEIFLTPETLGLSDDYEGTDLSHILSSSFSGELTAPAGAPIDIDWGNTENLRLTVTPLSQPPAADTPWLDGAVAIPPLERGQYLARFFFDFTTADGRAYLHFCSCYLTVV